MAEPTPVPSAPVPSTPASSPAPAAAPSQAKPQITFDQFAQVDLRIAKVIKAELHPSADRLLKLLVDDGSGIPRQICAGIRANYTPEQLLGRSVVIVANLAPRTIRGEESRGMLLAASETPKDAADPGAVRKVVVLGPESEIAPGAVVS